MPARRLARPYHSQGPVSPRPWDFLGRRSWDLTRARRPTRLQPNGALPVAGGLHYTAASAPPFPPSLPSALRLVCRPTSTRTAVVVKRCALRTPRAQHYRSRPVFLLGDAGSRPDDTAPREARCQPLTSSSCALSRHNHVLRRSVRGVQDTVVTSRLRGGGQRPTPANGFHVKASRRVPHRRPVCSSPARQARAGRHGLLSRHSAVAGPHGIRRRRVACWARGRSHVATLFLVDADRSPTAPGVSSSGVELVRCLAATV